ncbi:hypothetical protein CY34DRAFT_24807 [Suillus luteus UH-Slu-Lm8-n1]|uniref:DUF6589 domain-containing protein n=1 Tax=Suillus luteus UH-Slu-Lm8-n1 TaxID=930992 RepID=A0A0D0AQZ3_9AGAM|nr:hypothetical protein CY34DRAFT_24807 [Suillus luteus UH-Slu-Lm8-n1]
MSVHDHISSALKILRDSCISVLDLLIKILDPSEASYSTYRNHICVPSPKEKQLGTGRLEKMLDFLWEDPRSQTRVAEWLHPHAVTYVCSTVYNEMDDVKRCLHATLNTVTPKLLLTCNVENTLASIMHKPTPLLYTIIMNAAQTNHAKENNKIKDCGIACNIIITQLAAQCSHHSLLFSAPFTLFCWTNGVSHQTIKALYKCSLCISFTSLLKLLERLANQCCASAPAKVQSGMFAILYEVQNGSPAHMCLAPILQRAQAASDLMFNADVRPTYDQTASYYQQLCVHVLPVGYCTKQYPLCTSTIDESSISGNMAVVNDVYINQLKMTHNELSDCAIPSFNDQSTNARIRGAKALRTQDINPFTQLQFIQLRFSLFHLYLNLHPDYHTLLSTLLQILRGIILNSWKVECIYDSLAALASSKPTVDDLLRIAGTILSNHATPVYEPSSSKKKKQSALHSDDTDIDDMAHQNFHLLTRDLLYVLKLVIAISDGDWGRVEDILGSLAMVWTPEFVDIMCDNALVNFSGLEGHSMPIDLNIEHCIKFLKQFFAAKGIYSTWDHLGDISATVDLLQNVKKQVGHKLGITYHGLTHSSPDSSASVWKVANKINELGLHQFTSEWMENDSVQPVIDTLITSEKKMKMGTIATFNRKVRSMFAGQGFKQEENEIPRLSFDLSNVAKE